MLEAIKVLRFFALGGEAGMITTSPDREDENGTE